VSVDWAEVQAYALIFSGIAVVISLLLVQIQLKRDAEEEFVTATAPTFEIGSSDDFQRAIQWILYELKEDTWSTFAAAHRGKYGERAFYRVGYYYNRVGYLVTHHLLGGLDDLILDTVAGQAIAVWQKMAPLVLEARLIENSTLFVDFERMLPECYECYVPTRPVPPSIREGAAAAQLSDETK
jgi:hypothetical protein